MVPKVGIGKSIVRVIQYNFMVFTENTAKMDVAYQKIICICPEYILTQKFGKMIKRMVAGSFLEEDFEKKEWQL